MSFKKMFKRGLALTLVMVLVLSATACTGGPEDEGEAPVEEEEELVEESEDIVVTDHLGREVSFEEPAETIVSGYYISTSMMIALGLEDKVVGIEAKPERRPIYEMAAPEFMDLPNVGTMKDFDLEGTAALDPDLVILSVRLQDSIESLEDLGINVLGVNPESMEELEESLDMVGKATGTQDRADELKDYYASKMDEIEEITEGEEEKRVYLGGNSDFLSTASSQMYQSTLIENAGGENVAADIDDTYWATISYEQLIDYNPDVIIGAADASYSVEDIMKDDKLESVKAVENEEVYIMPSSIEFWDSPLPSGIVGTMWLTSVLHEEEYPFEEFKDETYDFYKEFYGVEIDKDELTK